MPEEIAEAVAEAAVVETETPAVVEATPEPEAEAAPDPDKELSDLYDKINSGDEPTPETEPEVETVQPNEEGVEPQIAAIDAPDSWTAEMREQFASLDPTVQEYVAQRERDAHAKISQMGQELSQWKPLSELREKAQPVFDRHGFPFEQAIERLVEIQATLDQNPLQGLAAIAQSYGINLAEAFGGQVGEPQQTDPQLARIRHELEQTKAVLTSQQREAKAREMQERRQAESWAAQTVDQWATGKEHFETVRADMQKMLSSGVAENLDDAYEAAIWRHPEIRTQLLAAQEAEKAAKARQEQEKAVQDAKRAAKVNMGGKPAMPKPKGNWDDDEYLHSAFDAIAAGG